MNIMHMLSRWTVFSFAESSSGMVAQTDKGYHRIVILSDVHLPGNNLQAKENAFHAIASWTDVDLVVVIGDLLSNGGTAEQLSFAERSLGRFGKQLRVVGGNHDYMYPDNYPINEATGHHLKESSPKARQEKLDRFKRTWGLKELFYSETMGGYRLVYLSPDSLVSNHYTQLSARQLAWFEKELERSRNVPTIVFFHGPPEGTYRSRKILEATTPDSYNAEPAKQIREVLRRNRQVFLWAAGHLHLGAGNSDFNSDINLYDQQVWVIHNSDMDGSSVLSAADKKASKHDTIWTNSLFLYPDSVAVRTYDHKQKAWLSNQDRTIKTPKFA